MKVFTLCLFHRYSWRKRFEWDVRRRWRRWWWWKRWWWRKQRYFKFDQESEVRLSPKWGTAITKGKTPVLFTEVKPCWTGLISGWVTISIKYPVLYSLGSQAGVVDINHAFQLYYNVIYGLSFSRSQPDFEGFIRALRFPPSAKLTPSLIQYAGPHW